MSPRERPARAAEMGVAGCRGAIAYLLLAMALIAGSGAAAQTLGAPPLGADAFGRSSEPVPSPPIAQPESSPAAVPAAPKATAGPKATPKPKPAVPARERAVAKDDPRPSFTTETLALTLAAAERYRAIAESGGWPALSAGIRLAPGAGGPAVAALARRLAAEGDLDPFLAETLTYDAEIAAAVKRFQARHGLARSGVVAGATLAALNVPAETRARSLAESARRLADSSFAFGARHVIVNIPAATVEAVIEGRVERRHVAVVGKSDRASPQVETRITSVNLNPTWTVPTSLIRKDIIPKMRKDPGYLSRSKIRIINRSGAEIDPKAIDWATERAADFTLRQDPGAGNALGQVRIDMPNREAVYMHDTPSKRLFSRDDRFHSSGCVRVEDVMSLVGWLLSGSHGWDNQAIAAAIKSGERKDLRLKAPVPVAWVYLTGYVTNDGIVHFRDDVYGYDANPALAPPIVRPAPRPAAPDPDVTAALPPPAEVTPEDKAAFERLFR